MTVLKVCILAAGCGSRSRANLMGMHKGLLPVGNRAVLSRIIEQFPTGTRYVIALGNYAAQVRDYLAIAHPDADIVTVDVDRFTGPVAGPGYSLLACRDHLGEPFIVSTCDTLVPAEIPPPDYNWVGVHPVENPHRWCTVAIGEGERVVALYDKLPDTPPVGYIGLAGIHDYERFWLALERGLSVAGESQVIPGLAGLVDSGIKAIHMPWFDTGDEEGYQHLLSKSDPNYSFDGKTTDVTYKISDRIIKFFSNPDLSAKRFQRGRQHAGIFAEVLEHHGHFFSYRFVPGAMLSTYRDVAHQTALLAWLQASFWRPVACETTRFAELCRRFYRDKTLERLNSYLERHVEDRREVAGLGINDRTCPTVAELLERLPDSFWSGGLASTFHGDLHADNVVIGKDGRLTLIDWRQDFAGETGYGDLYYDLAKYYHTIDLCHESMAGAFNITGAGSRLLINHDPLTDAEALKAAFWEFCDRNGYGRERVALINGLIFINMAPLYDRPLADYLYLFGRLRLTEALVASTGDTHS
ncbi:MAG: NTP transferase domain-containing protein [Alphaproteobacteria bacterium]|nr:NTP transferase domain-containing protein [Alphaproteobacteria bacterium]